jgi:hypothetical protein
MSLLPSTSSICYLGADNRWNSFMFHTNKNMHIIDLEGLKLWAVEKEEQSPNPRKKVAV